MSTSKVSETTKGLLPGLRFLVVEDDGFQRRMLAALLRRLGVDEVLEADSGSSALELLYSPSVSVDIIITDLDMPGMDGMELIRRLGESNLPASLIISSGQDGSLVNSVQTMSSAYGIPILGVLEKPPQMEKIERIMTYYLPNRQPEVECSHSDPPPPQYSRADIDAALQDGQFEPFFQPKVTLEGGDICGFEALARWNHLEKGILAPFAFIPIMEREGLIDNLTNTILDQSSEHCAAWRNAGLDIKVSVNLSAKSLATVGFAEGLINRVRERGMEPRQMILEITETALIVSVGASLENLARLRMNGFGLSIDDYGTGYSSLQQLSLVAASELKIDRSFITNASGSKSSRIILQATLEMARKLDLVVVAEGVETREDWDLLTEYHCDQAQGYLIAKPMPASAVENWTRSWQARQSAAGFP